MTECAPFVPGEIVTWSDLGRKTFPRRVNRQTRGEFKGWTRMMFARVKWDGRKTAVLLHPDFIKRVKQRSVGETERVEE